MLKLRGRGLRPRRLEMLVGFGAFALKAIGLGAWWLLAASNAEPAILAWLFSDSVATGALAFGVVWVTRIYSGRSHRDSRAATQEVQHRVEAAYDTVSDAVHKVADTLTAENASRKSDHDWLIAQLYEIRADLATVRSDTEFSASRIPQPRFAGAARRVLMVTSNGAGLGHLTRCLALAREFPYEWSVDILTMSTGWRKVMNEGVNLHYFPSKEQLGLSHRDWNKRFVRALSTLVDQIHPDVIFFDGTALYRGIHEVARQRFIPLVWIVRGGWRKGIANEQTSNPERFVDAVLLPGDFAIGEEVAPVAVDTLPVLRTPPLFYAPEILSATDARAQLGLEEGLQYVLIQLGAGNIDKIGDKLRAAAAAVASLGSQWRAVVVDSPIASQTDVLPVHVKRISAYPLSAYYRAFEFVVIAAGYNTVQEVLALQVPALIVPNPQTVTDDQARRAESAAAAGMSLCVSAAEDIPDAIRSLGNPSTRARLRDALSALDTGQGVPELESWVEEVMASSQRSAQVTSDTRRSSEDRPNHV